MFHLPVPGQKQITEVGLQPSKIKHEHSNKELVSLKYEKNLCLIFLLPFCQYLLVRTLTSDRGKRQAIVPFASLIYKKRLNVSAISWKLEALGPQAGTAVANLRSHESTKAGTAAVNGGDKEFKFQVLRSQVYRIVLHKKMHLLYSRTISAFFSNEFVPHCLSASELWETINHVHFFVYVDKSLFLTPTSL